MPTFPQITPLLTLDLESVNRLIIQLNEANTQIALAMAQMTGEDGRTPTFSSDIDLQGKRITNYGNGEGDHELADIQQLRENALYAERDLPHQTRKMIVARGGVRVPRAVVATDALPLEQGQDMIEGFVSGPASSTDGGLARWSGTDGRTLQDTDIGSAIPDLTDNTTGTANDTLQALTNPADSPASADALRDDLVANLIPELRNNYADLGAKINSILATLRDIGAIEP